MADDAKQAWSEVGEKFTSWGHRVAARYRDAEGQKERPTEEKEREIERAAKEIVDELGRGVSAFADTIKDDDAKRELTEAFKAMGEAIGATFDEVREGLRSNKPPTEPPPRPEGEPPTT